MADELPETTALAARVRLADTVVCAFGAHNATPVQVLVDACGVGETRGRSRIWLSELTASASAAALVNGTASRYLDANDTFVGVAEAMHPSDGIAALWAVAEEESRTFGDLIRSVILSYETACFLADHIALSDHGVDGVLDIAVGTAAGASLLMGLTELQLCNAIRLAVASGAPLSCTRSGTLSNWKGIAGPYAAEKGVFCAKLARGNITGPPGALDGAGGLLSLLGATVSVDAVRAEGHYYIERTSLKMYPGQYWLQGAIECALEAHKSVSSEIAGVLVEVGESVTKAGTIAPEKWDPETRETADHSLPACVAIALATGRLDAMSFQPSVYRSPAVRDVMKRLRVESVEESADHLAPVRLIVTTIDGRHNEARLDVHRGHWSRPVTASDLDAKFARLRSGFPVLVPSPVSLVLDRDETEIIPDLLPTLTFGHPHRSPYGAVHLAEPQNH